MPARQYLLQALPVALEALNVYSEAQREVITSEKASPSAIELLMLTILAPPLYQHQLNLGGLLVQQGAEE